MKHFVGLLLAFVVVTACHRPTTETYLSTTAPKTALSTIDSLMWEQPDSAFAVLMDFAASPEADSLDVFNGCYCQLLISELLYKNDYKQTNRPELLKSLAFFDSIGDTFLSARCHYMNGVGYYEMDSTVLSCAEFLQTLKKIETHFLHGDPQSYVSPTIVHVPRFVALTYGRLGDLFSDKFMQEPAIACYRKAFVFNSMESTSPYGKSKLLKSIGQQYIIIKQYDSAYFYLNQAMQQLPDTNNLTFRNLVATKALLDYNTDRTSVEPATNDLKRMAIKAFDESERLTRYFTISYIYYDSGQYDSACAYLTPVFENGDDMVTKRTAATMMRDIYQSQGDSLEATLFAMYLADNAVSEGELNTEASQLNNLFQSFLQWEQEKIDANRKDSLRLKRNKIIFVVCVFFLVAAFTTWLLHKRTIDTERSVHRTQQAALSGKLKQSNQRLQELRGQLEGQEGVFTKTQKAVSFAEEPICQLIMERVSIGQFKSKVDYLIYSDYALDKQQLLDLRMAADRHFGMFSFRLKKKYPELTKGDIDYCCLYLLGLTDADIAALMQRAYNTVIERKSKLKKILGAENDLSNTLRCFAEDFPFN